MQPNNMGCHPQQTIPTTIQPIKATDNKKQEKETIADVLYYCGKWKSTEKEYSGKVDVRYEHKKKFAKVQFVVETASGAAKLVLPYRKVLLMSEKLDKTKDKKEKKEGKDSKRDTDQFPRLTGELLGVNVTFSLNKECTLNSEKLEGKYKSRGTLLDDDGTFTVKRSEPMNEKHFKESTKCTIM